MYISWWSMIFIIASIIIISIERYSIILKKVLTLYGKTIISIWSKSLFLSFSLAFINIKLKTNIYKYFIYLTLYKLNYIKSFLIKSIFKCTLYISSTKFTIYTFAKRMEYNEQMSPKPFEILGKFFESFTFRATIKELYIMCLKRTDQTTINRLEWIICWNIKRQLYTYVLYLNH